LNFRKSPASEASENKKKKSSQSQMNQKKKIKRKRVAAKFPKDKKGSQLKSTPRARQ
jgi:hypothetical protein